MAGWPSVDHHRARHGGIRPGRLPRPHRRAFGRGVHGTAAAGARTCRGGGLSPRVAADRGGAPSVAGSCARSVLGRWASTGASGGPDAAASLGIVSVHECGGPEIGGLEDFRELLATEHGVQVTGYWENRPATLTTRVSSSPPRGRRVWPGTSSSMGRWDRVPPGYGSPITTRRIPAAADIWTPKQLKRIWTRARGPASRRGST